MITGNAISGMAVATSVVLKELVDNRDKVETYLAHGASRTEACIPVAREALRLACVPPCFIHSAPPPADFDSSLQLAANGQPDERHRPHLDPWK